jgi:hypothetical protein
VPAYQAQALNLNPSTVKKTKEERKKYKNFIIFASEISI